MKRLFAAIKIHPDEVFLKRYYAIKKALKDEKIKWVNPENIHITLKFFGETPEHHIPGINVALRHASKEVTPFDLVLQNTGIFGSSYNPRVIWFGIEPHDRVVLLSQSILEELEGIGIKRDRQNFVPHLTVARIKNLEDKKFFQMVIDKNKEGFIQKEEVNEFHLFESILQPEGPKYELIETFDLRG
ncbi:MAG: RNA 2',3'-cyclic phosphodiesterase [Bacteroidales bacterium]|nr:RNA 2',3'-cyclic phosphodiesterase [Bacteroidales bacterium]